MMYTSFDYLNKLYSFYMTAIVIISSRHGLRIEVHCRNQPTYSIGKSKLELYTLITLTFTLTVVVKQLYIGNKIKQFSHKGGCGMIYIKVFKTRTGLGYVQTIKELENKAVFIFKIKILMTITSEITIIICDHRQIIVK